MGRVAHINRAHRGSSLPVHTGDRRNSRRVRKTVVNRAGTGVGRDHHSGVGLADSQSGSAASAVVVAVVAMHCDVKHASRRGGSRRHGQRGIGKCVAAVSGKGCGELEWSGGRPVTVNVPFTVPFCVL